MQQIKTGDRCPLCGQIVTTTDPEILAEFNAFAASMELMGFDFPAEPN